MSIRYPKHFQDEESRKGKKFKFFKIEPINVEKKQEEPKKEINIGSGSGRINVLDTWRKNPQQGNINLWIRENFLTESYDEWLSTYLEECQKSAS